MVAKNSFKVNDKVILLDGRKGIVLEQDKKNDCYYKVKTHDDEGKETFYKIFYKDMIFDVI